MRSLVVLATLVVTSMLVLQAACSRQNELAVQEPAQQIAVNGETQSAWPLPAPSAIIDAVQVRSTSALVLEHKGSEFEPGWVQLAAAEGDHARMSPLWLDSTSSFATVAYAIYSFNLQGYAGVHFLRFAWDEAPADYSNLWIGLSRWGDNHWAWYPSVTGGQLFPPGADFAPYIKADTGEMLVAVVALGSAEVLLNSLRIGNPALDDWCTLGHDAQRTSRSPFTGPAEPTLKWTYSTGDAIRSSPAIAPTGAIYVGSGDGFLHAVNPDGSARWTCATGVTHSSSPAVAPDGTVYICGGNSLWAVDPAGAVKWSYPTGDIAPSSPVLDADGAVYFGSKDNSFYAINPDGSLKWSFPAQDDTCTPSLTLDGAICFGSWDHNCYALNEDGSQKWSYPVENFCPSAPAIATDGSIYFTEWGIMLHALDSTGMQQWEFPITVMFAPTPALAADGTLYLGTSNYVEYQPLVAISTGGVQQWAYDTASSISTAAAIDAQGTVYITCMSGDVFALNPDGTLKWQYAATEAFISSSPAIGADGTLYFGANDAKLYALGPDPG